MTAALEICDLRYAYPDGTAALRGVSLSVVQGQSVALIGPNGAGKSTLLLHLNGLLPDVISQTPGVIIGGLPVRPPHLHEIRRKVGLLFQDPNDQIFCPTVFEDVAFGPRQFGLDERSLEEIVADALAQVGLSGFESRAPHHLSGGEKRRVCLAGVLACNPEILVLDEPTSNLDPRGRRQLIDLLRAIPITKLIATHDLDLVVQLCPRTILLDRGQIVADGETIAMLSDERLMLEHDLERPHILTHQHPHR